MAKMSADITGDGNVSDEELAIFKSKQKAQRNLAIGTFIVMVATLALLLSPVVDETRISTLSEVLSMFYVGGFSLLGAFMGFSAWMGKSNTAARSTGRV